MVPAAMVTLAKVDAITDHRLPRFSCQAVPSLTGGGAARAEIPAVLRQSRPDSTDLGRLTAGLLSISCHCILPDVQIVLAGFSFAAGRLVHLHLGL